ncbi:MAG: cysteine--tRNA ligase [Patescibacteria group bacterium]
MIKLYNTLNKKVVPFQPIEEKIARIYTCGPTVYDHAHIGNLSSYIYADTLRRALTTDGMSVRQIMNYTDVDDKTIKRSAETYPDIDPKEALHKLTNEFIDIFLQDIEKVSIDTKAIEFVRATDSIEDMKRLISDLLDKQIAYTADDGVYLSIEAYKKSGKTYGQLLNISSSNTSEARINNDEYDKESIHDFALWKKQKGNEPSWEFTADSIDMTGRPGWHIECSAMSEKALGLPFDIHTGGIDLIFPHHENEIAQSTGAKDSDVMANYFVHSNHLLVDGKKMAKSANNFYTLQNIVDKGFDPLAFRLLVLQSHYRNESNFTWDNLGSAQNRLNHWRNISALQWQAVDGADNQPLIEDASKAIKTSINDDLNTPTVLMNIDRVMSTLETNMLDKNSVPSFTAFLKFVDYILGIDLFMVTDITDSQKDLISQREKARLEKDWASSDELRGQLTEQGIGIRDTDHGSIWYRI